MIIESEIQESEIHKFTIMNIHVDLDLSRKILNGEYSTEKHYEEIELKKITAEIEKADYGKVDFFEYTQDYLDRIEYTNYGTFRVRRTTVRKVREYHWEEPLYFRDMNVF